jgi:hypothetical protein
VGNTGTKITLDIVKEIKSADGYLLLNSKRSNYQNKNNIIVDPGSWINPSIYKIRESFIEKLDKILPIIKNFSNLVII